MSVIVYTTPTCPYCDMAKQYLDQKGVKYESIDVSTDSARAQEMIDKSGQMGVPVLDINGKVIVGFDKGAIDAALGGATAAGETASEPAEEATAEETPAGETASPESGSTETAEA